MREIKFRAWDKKLKRICQVSNIDIELKDVALFSIAYSMLEYDDGDDKYITKQITADHSV